MVKPRVPAPRYWITRDSYGGVVEDVVDVWIAPPERRDDYLGGFIEWLDDSPEGIQFHVQSMSVEDAKERFRTVPDNDRECVRVG